MGAATPEPATLIHPLMVDVTIYVPAVFTVIEDVVWLPGVHSNEPAAVVDNVDVPQLLTTVTTGVGGIS